MIVEEKCRVKVIRNIIRNNPKQKWIAGVNYDALLFTGRQHISDSTYFPCLLILNHDKTAPHFPRGAICIFYFISQSPGFAHEPELRIILVANLVDDCTKQINHLLLNNPNLFNFFSRSPKPRFRSRTGTNIM